MKHLYRPYPEDILKKIQQAQLEIYKDFRRVCDAHAIPFFANGGTMIGAVRHQGFIPWDDDMDLSMLRKDWNHFLQIFALELGEQYELICPELGSPYYAPVPKIARKGTVFQPELAARSDRSPGIYIEVFIYENISTNPEERQKQIAQAAKVRFWMFMQQVKHPYSLEGFPISVVKNVSKKLLHIWTKIAGMTPEKLNREFLAVTVSEEETGLVGHFEEPTTEKNKTNKAALFPLLEMPFEDTTMYMPSNFDEILRNEYGEYMKIPSEENRWNHAARYIRFLDGTEYSLEKIAMRD